MPYDLNNVREASFGGASFLVENSSVAGGRKTAIHKYVNSDRQVVEDLGLQRRTYDIAAIITEENYERDKKNLLSKLEGRGPGTLIHPFFGTLENMKPLSFTLTEDFTELGIAVFKIKFAPTDRISVPTKAKSATSEAKAARDKAVSKAKQDLKDKWKIVESIEEGVKKVEAFGEKLQKSIEKAVSGPTEKIEALNAKINNFKDKAATIAQDADELAQSIDELIYNAESAFETAKQNFDSFKALFDFGDDDDPTLDLNTEKQNEIRNNNNILNDCVGSYALNFAYYSFTLIDQTESTLDQIEFEEEILEAQYDNVVLNSFQNKSLSLDSINSITESRDTFVQVLSEIKTDVPDVQAVEVLNAIPLRALEYQYYGNTDRFDQLFQINQDPNISFYQGEVNLLNDNP